MYNTMESMNIAHCDVYTDTILCYAYSEAVVNSQHVTKVITVRSILVLGSLPMTLHFQVIFSVGNKVVMSI